MNSWWNWRDLILGKTNQAYRQLFFREDNNLAKTIFLILAVWVLSYIYLDYVVLKTNQGFFILLGERLAFTILTLALLLFLGRNNDLKKLDLLVLVWSLALVIVAFSATLLQPGMNTYKVSTHYVLIIGFYLLIPNRAIFKIIPAITLTVLDSAFLILLAFSTSEFTIYDSITSVLTLLALNVIGIMVASRMERQRFYQHLIQTTLSSGREQLIALAITDSLTGILNRRGFFELAEVEVDRYQRYQTTVSFTIIDLDNLKGINDNFGHPAGDLALQTLIECVEKNKRSSDFLGRLAGDEFGLCMPGIHKNEAEKLVSRIKEKLSAVKIPVLNEPPLRVYFSAGITEIMLEDERFDDLYRRADKALYSAKQMGRNRVEII